MNGLTLPLKAQCQPFRNWLKTPVGYFCFAPSLPMHSSMQFSKIYGQQKVSCPKNSTVYDFVTQHFSIALYKLRRFHFEELKKLLAEIPDVIKAGYIGHLCNCLVRIDQ